MRVIPAQGKGTSQTSAASAAKGSHFLAAFHGRLFTASPFSGIETAAKSCLCPDCGAALCLSRGPARERPLPASWEEAGRRRFPGGGARQKASPRMQRRRRAPFALPPPTLQTRRFLQTSAELREGGSEGRKEGEGEERRLHCGKAWNLETRKRRADGLFLSFAHAGPLEPLLYGSVFNH